MNKTYKIVFLVGMPGCGKTHLGKYAAEKLNVQFIDLDDLIVKNFKSSIAELFEAKGEKEFRIIESESLKNLIDHCTKDSIIATGGGTPCFHDGIRLMNTWGTTIWMDATLGFLKANIEKDTRHRPLFIEVGGEHLMAKLREIYGLRQPFYAQSRIKVSVYKGLSPDLFTKRLHLSTFAVDN